MPFPKQNRRKQRLPRKLLQQVQTKTVIKRIAHTQYTKSLLYLLASASSFFLLSHPLPLKKTQLDVTGETVSRTDVKKMSRANFMEILKGSAGGKEAVKGKISGGREGGDGDLNEVEDQEEEDEDEEEEKTRQKKSGGGAAAKDKKATTTSSWSALRDEYLVDSHMKLKDWDRGDDDQLGSGSEND